jgi:DNA segregation ATPase FtsK/SpoIIIE-like protein
METFSFDDPLLDQVQKMKDNREEISINTIQRKFRIGYIRAARLMNEVGLKADGKNSPLRSKMKWNGSL